MGRPKVEITLHLQPVALLTIVALEVGCVRGGFAPTSDSAAPAHDGLSPADLAADLAPADLPRGDSSLTTIYVEAESGVLTAPFSQVADASASGGFYLLDDNGPLFGQVTSGVAEYKVDIQVARTYFFWARGRATSTAVDSFFLAVGPTVDRELFIDPGHSGNWEWSRAKDTFPLTAGSTAVVIRSREAGSALDQFVLTADAAFVP